MTQQDLLNRLETELRSQLAEVRTRFVPLRPDMLLQRPNPETWNVVECIAHLNQYADDYLPLLQRAIHRAKARRWAPADPVRYTARGNRLIRRANPENGKSFKASKRYNFSHQPVGVEVLKAFIIKSEQLLRVIQAAREVDINRAMVPKAGAWFGQFTLGNLLEFLVLHTRRHIAQAAALLHLETAAHPA